MDKVKRQSGIELARLICMFMVLAGHANGNIGQEVLIGDRGGAMLLINQFSLVCVDVFVMISGWFSIKASWKGAAKLLFQVFYVTALCVSVSIIVGTPVSFRKDVLPYLLLGSNYWFVVSYLILYALSPIINTFIEYSEEKVVRRVILVFFFLEFFFGFLLDKGHFDYGFSPISFMGLYMLARYVRLYPVKLFSHSIGFDLTVYTMLSLLSAIGIWFGYKWFGMGFHLNHYDSPLAVAASLFFLLAFTKMDFKSEVVNWLASSAFAIYLFHTHSLVFPYFREAVAFIQRGNGRVVSALLLAGFLLAVSLFCILLDKPRAFLWRKLFSFLKPTNN